MRLFVAIGLPDDLRQALGGLESGLPGARWVAPENLHISLRFIGEADRHMAADIDAALSAIPVPAFPLTVSGLGRFGKGRKLRALWVGFEASAALTHLHGKIEQALQGTGLAPEGRRFKPHITLARFKSNPGAKLHAYLAENAGFQAPPFLVEDFALYSSFLSASGAIYTVEADYPLLGPDGQALVPQSAIRRAALGRGFHGE